MAKRKGIHPLVGAATLVPLAIGLFTPEAARRPRKPTHVKHFAAAPVGSACTLPFDAIKQEHEIDSSSVSKGETVNCKLTGIENNDIHIVLGQNVDGKNPVSPGQKPTPAQECESVTAEISPHFRPDVWIPDNLNSNNAHLFRFTGQLFFDAAHRPCVGGKGPGPKRRAIWEVHPTYAVDICIDPGNNCTADNDENWVALSDFVGTGPPSNETTLGLPEEISRDFGSARAATTQSRSWP